MLRKSIIVVMLGAFLTTLFTCLLAGIFDIHNYTAIGIIILIAGMIIIYLLDRWLHGGS